ncbi:Uma2 family endonuclease [Dethiobacter alkaliphilus]|uniref:Uma2 family endonuclease n=1 Tax=Dethiobacter alkaliphilus TaxID=427926 RepID=UPI0022278695|nr:Uma2 family endonuclease [Dethiobacter alkaliphilus]MCW3489750.1 Uma2 family endonuclease [Dethiobacter alkaliphilus]
MSSDNTLITAQALADALDLSVETIWRYTREKQIPFVELGKKQYRYNFQEVLHALTSPAVQEKEHVYHADAGKQYTYQDYLELDELPGYRHEILEGALIREPSPNVVHQRIVGRLHLFLYNYFLQEDPNGEVLLSPLDVTFSDITVVQPDLFYVSSEQEIIKETRIDGAPKLVVEVLSPSNGRKDRLQKLQIYQKAGVEHFWIINPQEKTVECFTLRDGLYTVVALGMEEDVLRHPDFDGLEIELNNLW